MKQLVVLFLFSIVALSQVPSPQIPMSGKIGPGGNFPLFNSGTINISGNYTMAYPDMSASIIRFAGSLSATATVTAPQAFGFEFSIQNATTGGHDIIFKGPTGTGVTIPAGQAVMVISDGTNYVSLSGIGGGGSGITSLNGATGPAVSLVAGSNITITPNGNNITIDSTATAGGSTALSSLTPATGTHTIDNASYHQTWRWTFTNAGPTAGLSFNEITPSTNAQASLLDLETLPGSQATPLWVTSRGTSNGLTVDALGDIQLLGTSRLKLPALANHTSLGTDSEGYVIAGSGGGPGGSTSISDLTDATKTNIVNVGGYEQIWNWVLNPGALNGLDLFDNSTTGEPDGQLLMLYSRNRTTALFGAYNADDRGWWIDGTQGALESLDSPLVSGGPIVSDAQMIAPQFTINPSPIRPFARQPLVKGGKIGHPPLLKVPSGRNVPHSSALRILSADNTKYLDINVPDSGDPSITSSTGHITVSGIGGGGGFNGASPLTITSANGLHTMTLAVPNSGNPHLSSSTGSIDIDSLFVSSLVGSGHAILQVDALGNVTRLPVLSGYLHWNGSALGWDTPAGTGGGGGPIRWDQIENPTASHNINFGGYRQEIYLNHDTNNAAGLKIIGHGNAAGPSDRFVFQIESDNPGVRPFEVATIGGYVNVTGDNAEVQLEGASKFVGPVRLKTPGTFAVPGTLIANAASLATDANGDIIAGTGGTGGPPTGTAGGDLSGTYPNPTVSRLRGVALPGSGTGNLNWNGTTWAFTTGTSWSALTAPTANLTVPVGNFRTTWNANISANFAVDVFTIRDQSLAIPPVATNYLLALYATHSTVSPLQASTGNNGGFLVEAVTGDLAMRGPSKLVGPVQLPAITNATSLATNAQGDIIAGTGGAGGGPPTGTASGDLSGTYPSPTISGLRGAVLPTTGTGNLNWNGTSWALTRPSFNTLAGATAANILDNNNFVQAWRWSFTSGASNGLQIGESAASTQTGTNLVSITNLLGSTAALLWVASGSGAGNGLTVLNTGHVNMLGSATFRATPTGGIELPGIISATALATDSTGKIIAGSGGGGGGPTSWSSLTKPTDNLRLDLTGHNTQFYSDLRAAGGPPVMLELDDETSGDPGAPKDTMYIWSNQPRVSPIEVQVNDPPTFSGFFVNGSNGNIEMEGNAKLKGPVQLPLANQASLGTDAAGNIIAGSGGGGVAGTMYDSTAHGWQAGGTVSVSAPGVVVGVQFRYSLPSSTAFSTIGVSFTTASTSDIVYFAIYDYTTQTLVCHTEGTNPAASPSVFEGHCVESSPHLLPNHDYIFMRSSSVVSTIMSGLAAPHGFTRYSGNVQATCPVTAGTGAGTGITHCVAAFPNLGATYVSTVVPHFHLE